MNSVASSVSQSLPFVAPSHLDQLWFQVGGTLCNFTCSHCFISCSPHNRSFAFLSREDVRQRVQEAIPLGVKEFYFTGGEPFLNPAMTDILCDTLQVGPVTVLTNASVFKLQWLKQLKQAEESSRYSLEFRVSLDGVSAETNDPIRGSGTFERTVRGIGELASHGFLPIITAVQTWPLGEHERIVAAFTRLLRSIGYARPRLKFLPTLKLGAEVQRTDDYSPAERISADMLVDYDQRQLLCEHSRIVTDRGVHVCPLLIEQPDSLLSTSLAGSLRPFAVTHGACYTCFQHGAICANPSSK